MGFGAFGRPIQRPPIPPDDGRYCQCPSRPGDLDQARISRVISRVAPGSVSVCLKCKLRIKPDAGGRGTEGMPTKGGD